MLVTEWFVVQWIARHESARKRVVIPRPQVVEAQIRVELLTPVHHFVGRAAADGERVSKRVIFVAVGHCAGHAGQLPHVAAAVIAVEARRPDAIDDLVLIDALQAVGIGTRDGSAAVQLVKDLRIARRIQVRFDEVLCGHAIHRLRHAVAEGIIHHAHRFSAGRHRHEVILGVVAKRLAARGGDVAVRVVGFAGQLVIGVEGRRARGNVRQRRGLREVVAHRIEAVANAAVVVAGRKGDGLIGEAVDAIVGPVLRAPIRFRGADAIADRTQLIVVAGDGRRNRNQSVQRVVCGGGLQPVGIRRRNEVAGGIVSVG